MKQEELVHNSIAQMKLEQNTEAKHYELEPIK
jgi:hypothetical protein